MSSELGSGKRLLSDLREGMRAVTAPFRDMPPLEVLLMSCANYAHLFRHSVDEHGSASESARWRIDSDARQLMRGYYASAYPALQRASMKVWHGLRLEASGILATGEASELLDCVMINLQCAFNRAPTAAEIPAEVFYIALLKAWLYGCDSVYLTVIDTNTNAWTGFQVSGDGGAVAAFVEANFADQLDFSVSRGAVGRAPAPARGAACSTCLFRGSACSGLVGGGRPEWERSTDNIQIVQRPARLNNLDAKLRERNIRYSTDTKRKTGIYSPSEFSIAVCDRQLAYGRLNVRRIPRFSANTLRIFDFGHLYHELIQESLERAFHGVFAREVPRRFADIPVSGTCDGEVLDVDVEIKSAGNSTFQDLTKPKDEHFKQANAYSMARPGGPPQIIAFLYMNKANGSLREFDVPPSKDAWRTEKARLLSIENSLNRGVLPAPYKNRAVKSVCEECPFYHVCVENQQDPALTAFEVQHGR